MRPTQQHKFSSENQPNFSQTMKKVLILNSTVYIFIINMWNKINAKKTQSTNT